MRWLLTLLLLSCAHARLPASDDARPGAVVDLSCPPLTPVRLAPLPDSAVETIRPTDSVTLTRTACFGVCPVYVVTLHADGRVEAVGERHVREPGPAQWRIDPALARRVLAEFVTERFVERRASMTAAVTDLPGAQLQLDLGGRVTTVDHVGAGFELELGVGGPDNAALTRLEALVDVASGARARFVGCPVER